MNVKQNSLPGFRVSIRTFPEQPAPNKAAADISPWRMSAAAFSPLVLAWDTFKAPRFSADEALRLARVVGLDFDKQVKNVVCEVKGDDVALWDSKARQGKGKLGQFGGSVMLDTLQHAALVGREQNTGVAHALIQEAGLMDDPTLLTALEVMLNVLPPPAAARRAKKADAFLGGAASDFEALEKLRQLAFGEKVPKPVQKELDFEPTAVVEGDDGEEANE